MYLIISSIKKHISRCNWPIVHSLSKTRFLRYLRPAAVDSAKSVCRSLHEQRSTVSVSDEAEVLTVLSTGNVSTTPLFVIE